ncbi:hypothetical protein B0H17DRAFT_1133421 [Mycena rosella]|uniref:Uncharacterized protein n=1 Tax=Mycena rosella TaxID=1033263 RepID=A0AAD7DIS9_MYCRO|nr:hypothetical protein B0H17DRAFT_1133421 [Mycena rosella]
MLWGGVEPPTTPELVPSWTVQHKLPLDPGPMDQFYIRRHGLPATARPGHLDVQSSNGSYPQRHQLVRALKTSRTSQKRSRPSDFTTYYSPLIIWTTRAKKISASPIIEVGNAYIACSVRPENLTAGRKLLMVFSAQAVVVKTPEHGLAGNRNLLYSGIYHYQ